MLLADRVQLFGGRFRAEDDAVAARALDGLDHQFVDPVEHLFALVVQPAPEGVHVGQQRLLAQVVLDDGRHVGVDEFVVAHPVADGAGDHHVARAGGVEQAGHAEHRIGPELHRVQVDVVDTPVDDVDLALALGGAHVDLVVAAEQVAAFDQLDAHLAGQQRMLEVRRVVDARGSAPPPSGRPRWWPRSCAAPAAGAPRSRRRRAPGGWRTGSGKTRAIVRRFSIT